MGVFEESIWRDARFSLSTALDIAESDYRDDFDERWGLDAREPPEWMERDDWLRAKKLTGLASQMAAVGASLLSRKGLGSQTLAQPQVLEKEAAEYQQQITTLLKRIEEIYEPEDWERLGSKVRDALLPQHVGDPRAEFGLFRNAFELEAAKLFPYRLQSMADRLHFLVNYLVRHRGDRMTAFLSRVASCYVLDLPTEFAVMARAVLDTALQESVDDETVRVTVGADGGVGLERRIAYFEAAGEFNVNWSRAARRVKSAGDDAAHTAPGLAPKMEELLADLATVISVLPNPTT